MSVVSVLCMITVTQQRSIKFVDRRIDRQHAQTFETKLTAQQQGNVECELPKDCLMDSVTLTSADCCCSCWDAANWPIRAHTASCCSLSCWRMLWALAHAPVQAHMHSSLHTTKLVHELCDAPA